MLFLRQACAAIVLVMLTLGMQSARMASLIEWAKSHFARGAQALGSWGSAVLVVRFTSLTVCLHILEILLWTAFYPVHARPFVYVPDRCGSFDCLRNLDHSCARRCGGDTAIERIRSGRGSMNYRQGE